MKIIDFYADWCQPCKVLSPVIEKFAKENPEVLLQKVNVDTEHELAEKYNVLSIPTVVIEKNGMYKDRIVGFQSQVEFERQLESYLKS